MAKLRSVVLLFVSWFFMRCICSSYAETVIYTLKQGEQLWDQDTDHLVSQHGLFKLGFFIAGASSILGVTGNSFLGIWYSKLPDYPDAIWVANPETPVVDSSGVFILDNDGKLNIIHGGGQIRLSDPNRTVSGNVSVPLLGNGNFVLREVASNGAFGKVLWESFNHSTNTLLPGMKLRMNFKTGENWTHFSWLSDQVLAPGAFRLGVDPGVTNQLVIWRGEGVYCTSGAWQNGSFQAVPQLTRRDDLFEFTFASKKEEKCFSYSLKNSSTLSRWELNSWGQILQSILTPNGTTWERTATSPCKVNLSHPNAMRIEKLSKCRNGSELFVPIKGSVDGTEFLYIDNSTTMVPSDCHATCWSDCFCVGYRSFYTSNGTGCVFMQGGAKFDQSDYFGIAYLRTIWNNSKGFLSSGPSYSVVFSPLLFCFDT